MRYRTAVDFRAALETRLRAESSGSGRSVQRLRRMVAFDRLLARLLVVAPDRWVLKGGLALDFRLGARTRFTRDMDLARFDARTLRAALTSVFAARGRQALPTSVPLPPSGWRDPYARLAETVGLDQDVLAGHTYASAFLTPVLATDDLDALWDNMLRRWIRSGDVT